MKKIFLIMAASAMLFACEKDQDLESIDFSIKSDGISIYDGILKFESKELYATHYRWVSSNLDDNENEINRFNESLGFKTLQEIVQEVQEIKDYKELMKYYNNYKYAFNVVEFDSSFIYEMASPIVCSYIANKDALIIVEDSITRFAGDYVYKAKFSGGASISKILEFSSNKSTSDVKVTKILIESSLKWGQYSYRTAYKDSKHRLVAKLKSTLYEGEYSIEAISATQRKRLGIWLGNDLSGSVGVKAEGQVYMKYKGTSWAWDSVDHNGSSSGQKYRYRIFHYYGPNWELNSGVSSIKVTHTGAGEIGTEEHMDLIKPLLNDNKPYVRKCAVFVTGEIGTLEHLNLIRPLLDDKFSGVRSVAHKAFENIKTKFKQQ